VTQSSGQDGIQLDAAFERREQLMFAHQPKLDPAMPSRATAPGRSQGGDSSMRPECNKPFIQFETMAIIAMCGLLFIAAFRVGHPLWSIPAMTLFSLTAITLLCALYARASYAVSRRLRKKRPEAGSVLAFP
jgi:hypothetical protein